MSEAALAVVGAGLLVALGALSPSEAGDALSDLAPTAAFLAALLVLARDGDLGRPGPKSIGHATRFVLDHATCDVLLVWGAEG